MMGIKEPIKTKMPATMKITLKPYLSANTPPMAAVNA
jgi:hypothetical protein